MKHDEPLADWEAELLGYVRDVTVRLTATHHDGSTTVIDGINCETFVWVYLRTEATGGWRSDGPLVLSVEGENDGLIYYVPSVKFYTTESITEWVKPA